MAVTKAAIAELITQLTGMSRQHLMDTMTDEQAQAFAEDVGTVLNPGQVFTPATITDFVGNEASIYSQEEAAAWAAAQDPVDIFTGDAGLAKLDAWATGAGYTKS